MELMCVFLPKMDDRMSCIVPKLLPILIIIYKKVNKILFFSILLKKKFYFAFMLAYNHFQVLKMSITNKLKIVLIHHMIP